MGAVAKRPLSHPSRRKMLQHVAASQGVTPQEILAVVAARKAYRRARMFRRRVRRRFAPQRKRRYPLIGKAVKSGMGEFGVLLETAGISQAEFARIAGVRPETVSLWQTHPLHRWPIELLRNYLWAKKMAQVLSDKGIDPEQFKPALPKMPMPHGRYPRKDGDLKL